MVIIYEINTPTIEDYKEVVQYFMDLGMTWARGETYVIPEYWWGKACRVQLYDNDKITCFGKSYLSTYHNHKIINIDEFHRKFPGSMYKYILKEFK